MGLFGCRGTARKYKKFRIFFFFVGIKCLSCMLEIKKKQLLNFQSIYLFLVIVRILFLAKVVH